jgi:hypothetical protein
MASCAGQQTWLADNRKSPLAASSTWRGLTRLIAGNVGILYWGMVAAPGVIDLIVQRTARIVNAIRASLR